MNPCKIKNYPMHFGTDVSQFGLILPREWLRAIASLDQRPTTYIRSAIYRSLRNDGQKIKIKPTLNKRRGQKLARERRERRNNTIIVIPIDYRQYRASHRGEIRRASLIDDGELIASIRIDGKFVSEGGHDRQHTLSILRAIEADRPAETDSWKGYRRFMDSIEKRYRLVSLDGEVLHCPSDWQGVTTQGKGLREISGGDESFDAGELQDDHDFNR